MIVPGMFVCSSFLNNVCMFIVSKTLLICLLLCNEEGSSPVSLQLLRGGIYGPV